MRSGKSICNLKDFIDFFRFTSMVHDVVSRGGRCLIPVFAVGPAQELMLILDEYWEAHPELSDIPIYCKV